MGRMLGERYRNGSDNDRRGMDPATIAALARQQAMAGGIELPAPAEAERFMVFDGHEFPANWTVQMVPLLYWAYKARRGDEAAIAILNAFGMGLQDRHGVSYWPMAVEPVPVVEIPAVEEKLGE